MNHMVYKLCSFFHTKNRLDLLNLNYMNLLGIGEEVHILSLIRPFDVRWISYHPSMVRLL